MFLRLAYICSPGESLVDGSPDKKRIGTPKKTTFKTALPKEMNELLWIATTQSRAVPKVVLEHAFKTTGEAFFKGEVVIKRLFKGFLKAFLKAC